MQSNRLTRGGALEQFGARHAGSAKVAASIGGRVRSLGIVVLVTAEPPSTVGEIEQQHAIGVLGAGAFLPPREGADYVRRKGPRTAVESLVFVEAHATVFEIDGVPAKAFELGGAKSFAA